MKCLGLNTQTMSIVFMLGILIASLFVSSYIVLSSKLKPVEGFNQLEPIYNSSLCGCEQVHEVPIWNSSFRPDVKPTTNRPVDTTYEKKPTVTVAPSSTNVPTPKKYSFVNTEIATPDKPSNANKPVPPKQDFVGDLHISTNKNAKRPQMTTGKYIKGAPTGFGTDNIAILN
jgi:hypothetical protein